METLPFLEDIYPDNLLYAATIRSPVAKGLLKKIDTPALPGNFTLITAKDIPGLNRLEGTKIPILAYEQLSYIGEPVAILLGDNKTKLEKLAAKCVVCVSEEKPVFSCKDPESITDISRELVIGDTAGEFTKNGKIITGCYETGIQDHWYAEPVGAICWYEKEELKDKLIVRTATQWPHQLKRAVIKALGIDPASVNIEPTALNLHFDGKLWYPALVACHAAIGVYVTKRPVRLILNREEDFFYTPKRASVKVDIASIFEENGKINAAEIDITVNLGSYAVNGNEILDQVCLGVLGLYKINNLKLTAKAKLTNIPPQGPFSGFGLAQGLFAIERHVSQVAGLVNQDPAEWRINHLNSKLLLPSLPVKQASAENELINIAAKNSDYYRKWSSHELLRQNRKGSLPHKGDNPRGIGIAAGFNGNGLLYHIEDKGIYNVEVTLTKESILEIKASITTSEDYNKIWEKVALETMSIKPEKVRIVSAGALDCGPSCSSRNITAITKLVEKCCLAIRKQRFHAPLPITVKRSIKPQNGVLLGGLFTPPQGKSMDITGFLKPGFAAAVVEVSIDLIECMPVIRGVWLLVDGGKIISKNRAKRSLTRGAAQALGWAFTENIEYINGQLPRSQYNNFTIFSPVEIPPIHIDFLEPGKGSADFNEPKGIGELPFTCIPAAFLQAVSQAMGSSFKSIPLKRKDIFEMIRVTG